MRKRLWMLALTIVATIFIFTAVPAVASSHVINNPDFETGDLSGWSTVIPSGGFAGATTSSNGYTPKNGSYFALLKTDGPGSYTTLSQQFTVSAGDIVSGWAFFYTIDTLYDDDAMLTIKQGSTIIATPFSASAAGGGSTLWTFWSYTFTTSGTYTVEARVANFRDGRVDSYMGLDNITLINTNQPPVAVIAAIADDTIPLPVSMKVTPQTLNLERLGKWVKAHLAIDEETTQETVVTLDGSGSYDPDTDPITYNWTLVGPGGEIAVDGDQSPSVTLEAGTYTATLVVNDGTVDSTAVSASFTLTNQTVTDLAVVDPSDYILNGVPASEVIGDEDGLLISFTGDDIADTVDIGLDEEMVLEGAASAVDYIDVIQDKQNDNGKGKSELKGKEK